ncbi:MAG: cbb3-type cytochrome oxidase assembly protein [Candidatus Melainabacteria bacterium]|nr:cbb3-type cytochrome oxidase assembly protein [Candidatus Melainabacteria bacterium]MBI3309462.1 cbb3-type cytochrome oxidase assembly protein [Candidatus Melainabacteria bacterium]
MCFVFFLVAIVFFSWAIKSGQLKDLEKSKFDMFEDDGKEAKENGK